MCCPNDIIPEVIFWARGAVGFVTFPVFWLLTWLWYWFNSRFQQHSASSQINVEISIEIFINPNEVLGAFLFCIQNWPIQRTGVWWIINLCHLLPFQMQSDTGLETSAKWGTVGKGQSLARAWNWNALGRWQQTGSGEGHTSTQTCPLGRRSNDLILLFLGSFFTKPSLAIHALAIHHGLPGIQPAD